MRQESGEHRPGMYSQAGHSFTIAAAHTLPHISRGAVRNARVTEQSDRVGKGALFLLVSCHVLSPSGGGQLQEALTSFMFGVITQPPQ